MNTPPIERHCGCASASLADVQTVHAKVPAGVTPQPSVAPSNFADGQNRTSHRNGGSDQAAFNGRLESVRGLAALVVALSHSFMVIKHPESGAKVLKAVNYAFCGQGAVIVFFILSGLVLGESMRRTEPFGAGAIRKFLFRRLWRIYPAHIFVLLLCFAYAYGFHWIPFEAQSPAFASLHITRPGLVSFLQNLVFWNFNLNGVTWTLEIEMICSAALVVMHVVTKNSRFRQAFTFMTLGALAAYIQVKYVLEYRHEALRYAFWFYLGYLIPVYAQKPFRVLAARPMYASLLLGTMGVICLSAPHFASAFFPIYIAAGILIALVAYCPNVKMLSILDLKILRVQGRISYSFYLLHPLILHANAIPVFRRLPAPVLVGHSFAFCAGFALVSILVTFGCAYLCYRFIELPFIAYAKRVT